MSDDLRNRVARAIANVREGGWPADTYALLQQHYLTMADAALAVIVPASVQVKPLVWEEPCSSNNHIYMAKAPWGTYGIHIDGGRHRAWLEAYEKPYERWLGSDDVGSVYEAQNAAQDDYEARIHATLAPATASEQDAARVLLIKWCDGEFEDSADAVADDAITDQWAHVDRTYPDANPIIEAWLRAIAEGKEC